MRRPQGIQGFLVKGGNSRDELKPLEVLLGPASLIAEHAPQRFTNERIARMVKGDGHAPAIGMQIVLVRTRLTVKGKTVAHQGLDELPGTQIPKAPVVDRHRLDNDSDLRFKRSLDILDWPFGYWLAVFDEALDHHMHDLIDVFEGLFLAVAPRCTSLLE